MLPIFEGKHVMVDIETLSQSFDAAIVSIGAVKFTFAEGIVGEHFKVNIDAASAKAVGLRIDKSTIDWWSKQTKEARDGWMKNPEPIDIHTALNQFCDWWGTKKDLKFWSNGISFDSPVLKNALEKCNIACPWKYYNERDLRTVYSLVGFDNFQSRKDDIMYHDSLGDAIAQTNQLISLFT